MTTSTILDQIVRAKARELQRLKREAPQEALEERIRGLPAPLNLSGALMGDRVRVIAEIKRASPSKGLLAPHFDPEAIARAYASNGAAAISVLTEVDHFQGSLAHLQAAKRASQPWATPVLRKDFLFDPYQVYEARATGADAILLIVAILTPRDLKELLRLSLRFFLQCLVEVHNEEELATALEAGAEVVGINNRDLRTFKTSIEVTLGLVNDVYPDRTIISESGIQSAAQITRLRQHGVNAFLVGEAFMSAPDPGERLRELFGEYGA